MILNGQCLGHLHADVWQECVTAMCVVAHSVLPTLFKPFWTHVFEQILSSDDFVGLFLVEVLEQLLITLQSVNTSTTDLSLAQFVRLVIRLVSTVNAFSLSTGSGHHILFGARHQIKIVGGDFRLGSRLSSILVHTMGHTTSSDTVTSHCLPLKAHAESRLKSTRTFRFCLS
jgi:hypothetical protein